jgi:hypothetical protein
MKRIRELTDKELDTVCGGGRHSSTGDIFAVQINKAVVVDSYKTVILQSNNNNTGFQL